jgi:hypothetical protein
MIQTPVACTLNNVTITIYDCRDSGLYYKHDMIINYASSSLARVVYYDHLVMPQF